MQGMLLGVSFLLLKGDGWDKDENQVISYQSQWGRSGRSWGRKKLVKVYCVREKKDKY